ncbi:MAG: hypothetical protein ACTSUE_04645, partial [Promethearchaeota archaeon]
MLIKKIILENITVHSMTRIVFKEGLNVLTGLNGAGKSTVLNMIGYLMFNCLPKLSKKEDFVRQGPGKKKHGSVTIWFDGKDGEEYSIKRTIGKNSSDVTVTHTRTGMEVNTINTISDYEKWMMEQLNVDDGIKLRDIFRNAIGVQQGTFTAPFLLSSSNKKQIFGPILNVDIYDTFYENYRDVNNAFADEIHEISNKISNLEGILHGKDDALSEKVNLKADLKESKGKLAHVSSELESIVKEFTRLDAIKKQLESAEAEYNAKAQEIEGMKVNISTIKGQLSDAESGKKICDETEADFKIHASLLVQERDLNEKKTRLDSLKEEKNTMERDRVRLEAEIKTLTSDIQKIEASKGELATLEGDFNRVVEIRTIVENLNREKTILGEKSRLLSKNRGELEKLQQFVRVNVEKIKEIETLERGVKDAPRIQESILNLERKNASLVQELKTLKSNRDKSITGNCPFLGEPCKNIGEQSLSDHFQAKIDVLNDEHVMLESSLQNLREVQRELVEKRERLDDLRGLSIELQNAERQISELETVLQELVQQVSSLPGIDVKIRELKREEISLKEKAEKYTILKQDVEVEYPRKKIQVERLILMKQELDSKINPLQQQIKNLAPVQSQYEMVKKRMDETRG